MRRMLAAGNWKMNGLGESLAEIKALNTACPDPSCDIVICPQATLVGPMVTATMETAIQVGGQDCHADASGAHTGDTSAEALADAGASHVIVGHSERRANHAETDAQVHAKAEAAWRAGLVAIICVGETEAQRDAGQATEIVIGQMTGSIPDKATPENTVVAYEPVWAIGTGRVPSIADIDEIHQAMRTALVKQLGNNAAQGLRLLYGGSVKGSNATEIFALNDVDGGLVGGASLKAADFAPIVDAASVAG